MRILRKLFVFGGIIILLVAVAAWKTPAAWIANLMNLSRQGISYARITGTFWKGEAEEVKRRDLLLGDIKWDFLTFNQFNPLTTTWKIDGKGHDYELSLLLDTVDRDATEMRLVQGHIPAGWVDLSDIAPLLFLTGQFNLDLDQASPQGNLSNLATGMVRWTDAGLGGLVEESLGTVIIDINTDNRFTIFDIQSDPEADIQLDGQVRISGRQYESELVLRTIDEKQYVIEQMSELGTVKEDGSLEINLSGRTTR